MTICAVGFGRGRGDCVVSTYETVTNGSAVVAVIFGFRVISTVPLCCVDEWLGVVMIVVRR